MNAHAPAREGDPMELYPGDKLIIDGQKFEVASLDGDPDVTIRIPYGSPNLQIRRAVKNRGEMVHPPAPPWVVFGHQWVKVELHEGSIRLSEGDDLYYAGKAYRVSEAGSVESVPRNHSCEWCSGAQS